MKVGDLVGYPGNEAVSRKKFLRLGVVIEVSLHQRGQLRGGSPQPPLPMATVHWNGIDRPMKHRQDLLEVFSENR